VDELDLTDLDGTAVLAAVASQSVGQIGAENFPVALRLVPRRPRAHLIRFYSFARFVDDVGDEAPGDRECLLDLIEQDVLELPNGRPTIGPVRALKVLVDECGVPVDAFVRLIAANRMDQHISHYNTFDDLLDYCRLSAAPVGLVVLHVAGAVTEQNIIDSDLVCAGLQVLEHCQDVGEDARAGRVYLPATDLRTAGIGHQELIGAATSRRLRGVVSVEVERAAQLLEPGRALVRRLSGWSRLAVSGYIAGGLATAAALRSADHDVLARHIAPSKIRTAAFAARLVAGR
jgi:squalene synthase HpnC